MTDILDDSYESDVTEEEDEGLILVSEHAIAKPLSTEARKVFEAFNSEFDWVEDGVPGPQFKAIAAALRAAADQVVPLQLPPETAVDANHPTVEWHVWNAEQQSRFALLAIATELEAQ